MILELHIVGFYEMLDSGLGGIQPLFVTGERIQPAQRKSRFAVIVNSSERFLMREIAVRTC